MWFIILSLLISNSLLLAPAGNPVLVMGSVILLFLPGFAWGWLWLSRQSAIASFENHDQDSLTFIVTSLGLSYSLIILEILFLSYAGWLTPTSHWLTLNGLTLLPIGIVWALEGRPILGPARPIWRPPASKWLLILILMAAGFQLINLGHSEFAEDEAEVMLTVAHLLNGHSEALFVDRRKGPAEVILPAAMWSLTGLIDEATARLLFALAGILTIPTIYRLAELLFEGNDRIGLLAATFLSLNGFVVAFGRRVQYHSLVIWLTMLALICVWQWRQQGGYRWPSLTALFVGIGLLAHYDMVAVLPPMIYLLVTSPAGRRWRLWLMAGGVLGLITGLFYLPYLFNDQASTTGQYLLVNRIGSQLLKNTLDNFVQANVMFTSVFYFSLTGLAVAAFLVYALAGSRPPTWRLALAVLLVGGLMSLLIEPTLLQLSPAWDLAALPFILILTLAIFARHLTFSQRLVMGWLAVTFIGYTFGLTRPRSHVYILVPAWVLLVGLMSDWLVNRLARYRSLTYLTGLVTVIIVILFGSYLYLAYVRTDLNWRVPLTEWPARVWRPPLHDLTSPYFFGTVNMAYGWRAVGGLYATGQLNGSYYSNDSRHISAWYTRQAPTQRAEEPPVECHRQPDYYVVAEPYTLPPKTIDWERVNAYYQSSGFIPYGARGMSLYQLPSKPDQSASLDVVALERAFYQTSWATAYRQKSDLEGSLEATFNDGIQLTGFNVEPQFPRPGGRLTMILNWQARTVIPANRVVFVHLTDETTIWGQSNQEPVCGYYPTSRWQPGQLILDQHFVEIAPDTPPGNYSLRVGLYDSQTGDRLTTEEGDTVMLTTILIEPIP